MNLVDMPIKCPVAPLELAFLADWHLRERGSAAAPSSVYATPLDGAFTKPVASERLGSLLADKEIELVTEFNAGEVDAVGGTLTSYDGRELALRPARHGPAARWRAVRRAVAGARRRARLRPDRQAHTAGARRAERLRPRGRDRPPDLEGRLRDALRSRGARRQRRPLPRRRGAEPGYDGHANCFIETGFHKALLIDFNYETEPLPGRYPTAFGLPLLRESRLNHLGKLAFQWVYWHALLPGRGDTRHRACDAHGRQGRHPVHA